MQGIDHLVLPVTTLSLARSRLSDLGFTVAPDARHPFGTGNCCVFFRNGTYLEPVTILDRAAADMAAAGGNVFVRQLKRFSERHGEGLAMVALRSEAESEDGMFADGRLGEAASFRFARMAVLPDGGEREIGFVLGFADAAVAADATFFACRHLAPGALFHDAYLAHRNGALGVSAVAAVAVAPEALADFLTKLGGTPRAACSGGMEAEFGAQRLLVLTPAAFRERYDIDPPEPRRGIRLAAMEIAVPDLHRAAACAGAAARQHAGRVIVPPAPGLGAVLAFEARDG
jgi:hypothetical protein